MALPRSFTQTAYVNGVSGVAFSASIEPGDFDGTAVREPSGWVVGPAGDVNGDDHNDLIVDTSVSRGIDTT